MPIRTRRGLPGYQLDITIMGRRIQRQFPTLDAAQTAERELLAAQGVRVDSGWTLGKLMAETIATVWRGSKTEHSASLTAARILAYWGDGTPVDAVTSASLAAWITAMRAEGISPATMNRRLANLGRALTLAEERSIILRKPRMPRLKEFRGRNRFLTHEEEATLINGFKEAGDQLMADLSAFLIDTGCRLGEALRATGQDITTTRGTTMLAIWQNKADVPRSVPLTQRAAEIVRRRSILAKGGRLFPRTVAAVEHAWGRMRVRLGWGNDKQMVLHALRHTCASRLAAGGCPILALQQWLGHKTLAMTMRYAHLAPDTLAASVSLLERKSLSDCDAIPVT